MFLLWGALTAIRGRSLFAHFDRMELLWVVYNAALCILFLIRSKPSVVSTDPIHWAIALGTAFSGLLFERHRVHLGLAYGITAHSFILVGIACGAAALLMLGRSYDLFPAVRRVKTRWFYGWVRHPIYIFAMVVRLGYVLLNLSPFNVSFFLVIVWLYDRRAAFEESILASDERYAAYARRVPYRFVPGVY
ncbi:MAG: methyltransferase family protein [Phycisphaerae bacterium]